LKFTFACSHCGKPLVADTALAGRTGRCRSCGHRAVVPSGPDAAQQATLRQGPAAADWRTAVASQLPTPAGGAARAGGRAAAGNVDRPSPDVTSGYKLRPVTPVGVPPIDASDWSNAELGPAIVGPVAKVLTTAAPGPRRSATASTRRTPDSPAAGGFGALGTVLEPLAAVFGPLLGRPVANGSSSVVVAYRTFFGLLGRWTAWISETSYTVSFIIIILAVASGMTGRHSLAALGCGAIVAFNLVGLAGDLTSLVTLSYRKNPLQGTLFLVPPFTLYYLWSDWQRYRDTVVRMRTPLLTLAAVAVAYVFVPWLHGGSREEGRIVAAVKRAVDAVEESVAGRKDALDDGLKKARTWLRDVPLPDPSSLPGLPDTLKPAHGHKP
jgi:hypothetical protein